MRAVLEALGSVTLWSPAEPNPRKQYRRHPGRSSRLSSTRLNVNDILVILWTVTLISAIFGRVTIESQSRTKTSSSSNLAPGDIMQYSILYSKVLSTTFTGYIVDIVSSGSRIHLKCSPTGAETRSRVPGTRVGTISSEFPFNKTASSSTSTQVMLHDGLTLYEEDIVVVLPRPAP
ncbi:hypothetical protein EAG_06832 [Camponotus floridanus]|uniref:Uncharacterized protein n=1 Tax=Camponotus floridanus TaxID=104421 RepID=E2A1H5_CAMFO|nr:hypothetical protein EAG_06832 [Camponotus floridanus]